jgi:hypothetical protein
LVELTGGVIRFRQAGRLKQMPHPENG